MGRSGYTLVEMIVVILIIGSLAALGVPQYLRTVETGKADDAVGLVNQIGMTNRMFALDHRGVYAAGQFPNANGCGCGATPCSTFAINPPTPVGACALVCCGYLSDQAWVSKPYTFNACDPASGAGGGSCGGGRVSAGTRRVTAYSPYNTWTYYMETTGRIVGGGTAPPAPTY